MSQNSLQNQRKEKERKLEERLVSLRVQSQEEQARALAAKFDLPYIDLKNYPIDIETLSLIPEEKAKEDEVVAFYKDKITLRVGMTNPENSKSQDLIRDLAEQTGLKVSRYVISRPSLERALEAYKRIIKVEKLKEEKVHLTKEELARALESVKNLPGLKKKILEVSATELVGVIFAGALTSRASDTHFEPEEVDVKLRYRIDGILHDIVRLPYEVYSKILTRIKLLSHLKVNVTDIPQDGRFSIETEDRKIDLRVSTLPTAYGESLVVRLLGTGETGLGVNDLGFRGRALEIIEEEIRKPNGMILTTGPTGSGKTTTLYAFLNRVKTPEVKIITLENPIEYKLEGISQMQVEPKKGMTFAAGLRAILRQDPDVVMVGEIRDLETAEIAAQAALTGHLVFSTLHTNDAAGAILRLINMGIRPYTLGSALTCVIAQRLVRRLCSQCKVGYKPKADLVRRFKEILGKYFPKEGIKVLYKQGKKEKCLACQGLGYKGRLGIFEVFAVTDSIRELINQRASALEIKKQAQKEGMLTMKQDGLLKVIEGITSLEELERMT